MRKLFAIEEDQARFNRLLVRGHLVAQGPTAREDVVRATLLKLANMLAAGRAGQRAELAERLVDRTERRRHARGAHCSAPWARPTSARTPISAVRASSTGSSSPRGSARARRQQRVLDGARLARGRGLRTLLDGLEVAGRSISRGSPRISAFSTRRSRTLGPYPSLAATISRSDALDGSSLWSERPRNLQDPLTFRTLPQVLAATRDGSIREGVSRSS
jgi:hypothetical protein